MNKQTAIFIQWHPAQQYKEQTTTDTHTTTQTNTKEWYAE